MDNFLYFYQHLPLYLNPTVRVGFFPISWYSIMYLMGFGTVYCLLRFRIAKGECNIKVKSSKLKVQSKSLKLKIGEDINFRLLHKECLLNFLIYAFVGLLVGARLGDVLFYNLGYYIQHPLAIISPFDPVTHEFVGIYGMSYHGGLIGVLLVTIIFIKKYYINFWNFSDFVVPAIPAGYFFGRIGNFINNELYGRITDKPWGMYFKDYPWQLRHPSQLYEALLEGAVLFVILWTSRNKKEYRGLFLAIYIIGYAIFRFICEYFREPDDSAVRIFPFLTLGQIFSLIMILTGLAIIIFQKKKKLV